MSWGKFGKINIFNRKEFNKFRYDGKDSFKINATLEDVGLYFATRVLLDPLNETFSQEGADYTTNTMMGVKFKPPKQKQKPRTEQNNNIRENPRLPPQVAIFLMNNYKKNPKAFSKRLVSTIFGFSTRVPVSAAKKNKDAAFTWTQGFKNYFGISSQFRNSNVWRQTWEIVRASIFLPFRIGFTALNFAHNVMKFFGVYVPQVLEQTSLWIAAKLVNRIKQLYDSNAHPALKGAGIFGLGLLTTITMTAHYAFKMTRLIDRAFIDPAKSIRAAWQATAEIGGVAGTVMAGILTAASVAITVATYTAFWWVTGPALAAAIDPVVKWANGLPAISSLFHSVGSALSSLAHTIGPYLSTAIKAITFGKIGVSSTVAGVSGAATTSFVTLGFAKHLFNKFSDWWHTPKWAAKAKKEYEKQPTANLSSEQPKDLLPSPKKGITSITKAITKTFNNIKYSFHDMGVQEKPASTAFPQSPYSSVSNIAKPPDSSSSSAVGNIPTQSPTLITQALFTASAPASSPIPVPMPKPKGVQMPVPKPVPVPMPRSRPEPEPKSPKSSESKISTIVDDTNTNGIFGSKSSDSKNNTLNRNRLFKNGGEEPAPLTSSVRNQGTQSEFHTKPDDSQPDNSSQIEQVEYSY